MWILGHWIIWLQLHPVASVSLTIFRYQLFTWQNQNLFWKPLTFQIDHSLKHRFHVHVYLFFHFHFYLFFYFHFYIPLILSIVLLFLYVPLFLLVDRETSFTLKHRCVSVLGIPITLILLSVVVTPGPCQISVNGVRSKFVSEIFQYLTAYCKSQGSLCSSIM